MPDSPIPSDPRADLIRAAVAFLAVTPVTGAIIPLGDGRYVVVGALESIRGLAEAAKDE